MRQNKFFIFIVSIASIFGIIDAGYLAMGAYVFHVGPQCGFVSFKCDAVMQSPYNTFLGLPLSVWGLGYYALLFMLCMAHLDLKKPLLLTFVRLGIVWGVLFSGWLIYAQAVLLHAWCFYCVVSEVLVGIMAVALAATWCSGRRNGKQAAISYKS